MSSIKNLEMAAAVSAYQNITIKKSLFSTKGPSTPLRAVLSRQRCWNIRRRKERELSIC